MSDEMPHVTPTVLPTRPVEANPIEVTPVTIDTLSTQVAVLTSRLQDSQTQIADNFTTMSNLGAVINNTGNSLNGLTTQVAQDTTQLAAATATLAGLQQQVAALSTQLASWIQTMNTFLGDYAKHTHAVPTLWTEATLGNLVYIVPVVYYAPYLPQENAPELKFQDSFTTLAPGQHTAT